MTRLRIVMSVAALLLVEAAGGAHAEDTLTFAVAGTYSWDSSVVPFGNKLGFFAKHGLKVNVASTDSTADNLQALIAGSADIGVVSVPTFIGAAVKGAPVKLVASAFYGTSDFLWYARSDSPIKSFKDITERTNVGVLSLGASSYAILSALLDQYGVKANVVATGNTAATMTQVMAGQLDVGTDGNGLLGVPQIASGEIRVVAYGRELESMRKVTVRALAAGSDTIGKRRDVLIRFLQAYQESIDWMYSHPEAVAWFAEQTQSKLDDAKRVVQDCYPQASMVVGEVGGLQTSIEQGLKFKRIPQAPTAEQISTMVDPIWKP
jgi:NitT/TauT family transport system substrate-binding protein